jgi:CRP-like cAMP-binding protein
MNATPEDEIARYIARFAAPPANQVRDFIAGASRSFVLKGEFLVEPGDTTHPLYFVHSGIVRYMIILSETGKDITKDFSSAPTFAASFGSAVKDLPGRA